MAMFVLLSLSMNCFNNFSFMSWNIRGASDKCSLRHLREMVKIHNSSFFLYMKLTLSSPRLPLSGIVWVIIHSFCKRPVDNLVEFGFWVTNTIVYCDLVDSMDQSITFSLSKRHARWFCSAIYASPNPSFRANLLIYLRNLSNTIRGPWLMMGDMND